jgi:hypothetical protein
MADMNLNKNVSLRENTDTTNRESAPPAGGALRHAGLDVGAASIFSVIQGGIPGCAVKFD